MLKNKVAIITGGARGMGASHVKQFVEEGAKVVFTDVLVNEGEALAQQLGGNVRFIAHDVTNAEQWKHVIQLAETTFGPVNILVNNAAISVKKSIEDLTEEEYRKVIDVNQIGVLLGMKAVISSMKKCSSGSIINISSILGIAGREDSLAYVSTKFAVNGMTKSAALEFAPFNIRVNSIHPGSVKTKLTDLVYKTQQELDERAKNIPLQRFGTVEEVSNLVVFLASDKACYSTGSEFVIDGGLLARI